MTTDAPAHGPAADVLPDHARGLAGFMLPIRGGVALWVFAFVAFIGTYVTTYLVTLRAPAIVAFALPLVVWAALRLRGPRTALDSAICAALGLLAAVSFFGVDPLGSLETVGLALVYALLFWCMRDEDAAWLRTTVATTVVMTLGGWIVAIAIAWIGEKAAWYAAGGRGMPNLESHQVFVWGSANAYPILVLLAFGFLSWVPAGGVRRVAGSVIGLASLVAVPFSAGRAGWLGIAVALLAYEALGGWPRLRSATSWLFARRWGTPAAAVAAGLVVVGLVLASNRLMQLIAMNLDSRWRIWEQAVGVFGADPVSGSGPGTYSWMRLFHVPDYQDRVGVVLSHNVLVQTIADGGLLLLAGLVAVSAAWLVAIWRSRSALTAAQRVAAAGVMGFGAASLLDDFSYLPAIIAMAVTLAAWSLPRQPEPSRRRGRRWALLGVAALLLLAVAPGTVLVERGRLIAVSAREAAIALRWDEAASEFAQATELYPTNPANYLGLGLSRAELGQTDAAVAAYAAGRALSQGDPRFAGALAALAHQSGDDVRAASLLEEAAQLSNDPQYAWRLAELRLGAGDEHGARQMFATAIALRSSLFASLPVEVDPVAISRAMDEATRRVGSISGQQARRPIWDVALATGSLPNDAPAAWQAVALAELGAFDAARGAVELALERVPYDEDLLLARVAVARFACDDAAVTAALRLAPAAPLASDGSSVGRDPVYREPGIGDYQPRSALALPALADPWPAPFVEFPSCG